MQMPNTTAEQQARDMLERMGVPNAQCYAASDLVELANLIADRARAALAAEPQGDVRYEFSIFNGEDEWQAGGDAPDLEQAMQEGQRYLSHYSSDSDGPYRLELRRTELLTVSEAQP